MPKMKTNKSAAKRFKTTARGRIKRYRAYKGHLMAKKRPKRRRNLRKAAYLHPTDIKELMTLIPYLRRKK
jgi:large subunit ribosomal protein L35